MALGFLAVMGSTGQAWAQTSVGECFIVDGSSEVVFPNSQDVTEGQTIVCKSTGTETRTSGIQAPENTTVNNVTVTIENGAAIVVSGSTIGLGNNSIVTNQGLLDTSSFTNGHGISSGANGRSEFGGNTILNDTTGVIRTGGGNAVGILINARRAGALGNTITNEGEIETSGSSADGIRLLTTATGSVTNTITNTSTGTISTTGDGAHGIHVNNARGFIDIINDGAITVTGSGAHGVFSRGAVNLTISGSISSTNGDAIHVTGGSGFSTEPNTVTIKTGATITGNIVFDAAKTAEKLVFDGFNNSNFNNSITGLNNIDVINGAAVTMSASSYEFGVSRINVATGLDLKISGQIVGSTSITKVGAGQLTFSGSNSYTGDTNVNEGVLFAASANTMSAQSAVAVASGAKFDLNNLNQTIGSLSGSGDVDIGTAILTLGGNNRDTTFSGTISGTGGLVKRGSGVFTLSGNNAFTGPTTIDAGTLALRSNLTSNVTIAAGGSLAGGVTVTGNVTNAGTIQPRLNGARSTLTVVGNYVGQGGVFASTLGGTTEAIEADRLAIRGTGNTASGTTTITVSDPTGVLGQPTVGDGILLVDVSGGATSTTTSFNAPRIAAGAYEYTLVRGGEGSAQNWYLRADIDEPAPRMIVTPTVAQREEVALYPSLPSLARQYLWSINGTLDDRRGAPDAIGQWQSQPIAWGRFIGQDTQSKPGNVNNGPGLKTNEWALQLGADLWRSNGDWGQWRVGPVLTIGRSSGNAFNASGSVQTGQVGLNAYSLGLNATVASRSGGYADLLVLATRLTGVQASSPLGTSIATTGWAYSGSLEGGWRMPMTGKLAITPQAQLYNTTVNLNNATDAFSLIKMPSNSSWLGRLGMKLSYDHVDAQGPKTQFWARASVFSTLAGQDASTSFLNLVGTNPTTFQSRAPSTWMALDAALNVQATPNTSVQFGVGYQTSFNSQYRSVYGQINVRVGF